MNMVSFSDLIFVLLLNTEIGEVKREHVIVADQDSLAFKTWKYLELHLS